jgi:hypothetical protein
VLTGAALEGRSILYRWPVAAGLGPSASGAGGWPGFSKGVRYARGSAALGVGDAGAASLLDAPSHGPGPADRWARVLLCQA